MKKYMKYMIAGLTAAALLAGCGSNTAPQASAAESAAQSAAESAISQAQSAGTNAASEIQAAVTNAASEVASAAESMGISASAAASAAESVGAAVSEAASAAESMGISVSEAASAAESVGTAVSEAAAEIVVPSENVKMQYVKAEDLAKAKEDYLIIDLRKAADYKAGHIPGAISADLDSTVSGGDVAASVQALLSYAKEERKIALVCYTGNRYAQAGTNALSAIGADMSRVYTLEGGMKKWSTDFADQIEK